MPKYTVLAVAPYDGLKDLISRIAEEFPDLSVHVIVGNLIAYNESLEKYDVIVSRGGTAEMLELTSTVPVVRIEISGYDFARALTLAHTMGKKTAVVGFSPITRGVLAIRDVLRSDLTIFTIANEQELENRIQQLVKEGYELVLGDVITVAHSKRAGLTGILLTSGEESVRKALEEAGRIAGYIARVTRTNSIVNTVLQKSGMKYLLYDMQGRKVNDCGLDSIPAELESYCKALAENIETQIGKSFALETGGRLWTGCAEYMPDNSGTPYYAIMLNDRGPSSLQQNGITIQNRIDPVSQEYLISLGERIQDAERYASARTPVVIVGKPGTGRDALAAVLHGVDKAEPFVTIDCQSVTEEGFKALGSGFNELLGGQTPATLYFRHIDLAGADRIKRFGRMYASMRAATDLRLIASVSKPPENLLAEGALSEDIYSMFCSQRIYTNELAGNAAVIRELINYFINEGNYRFGKQVVALEDDALDVMLDYAWPANVLEIRRVIFQLVQQADGVFITRNAVSGALPTQTETNAQRGMISWTPDETLEDITKRVLEAVVKEENGNLSRVAKRLDISRSTIWRRLKPEN